jgi:hypothetical protein
MALMARIRQVLVARSVSTLLTTAADLVRMPRATLLLGIRRDSLLLLLLPLRH